MDEVRTMTAAARSHRMRKWIFLLSACLGSTAEAAVPELFQSHRIDAAMLARAVNHFVGIGEQASIAELAALAPTDAYSLVHGEPLSSNEMAQRVGWMCLILWPARPGQVQRSPRYGGLMELEGHLSPADWPLYPVALVGHSYFVLGTQYLIAGHAESPRSYLADCESKGVFRALPVEVPTRAQAQRDAFMLRQSVPWQAGWSIGHGSPTLEQKEWLFIEAQADSIE